MVKFASVLAVSLSTLMGLHSVATAEPSATVQRLMNQPVSLFSFGLIQLQEYLEKQYGIEGGINFDPPLQGKMSYVTGVIYDWNKNRINITLLRTGAHGENWDFDAECKQIMASLRANSFIDVKTGKHYSGAETAGFSGLFMPEGYSIDGINADFLNKIDQIIELRFSAYTTNSKNYSCSAPLLGTGYSVEQN